MQIAPLTFQDVNAWATLLALCFHRTEAEMVALLHWLNKLGNLVAWGAWEDNQLVAQYTCLIRSVYAYDTLYKAGMSMNMAVHPDYRGRGLIKHVAAPVYDSVQQQGGMMGLGFSNADGVRVDRNSKSYGYQVIGQMQPVIGLLQASPHPNIQLCDHLPGSEQGFNDACQLDIRQNGIAFLKTPDTFISRYAAHPFRKYQYGIWEEAGQIQGIVVYRDIQILGIPCVALLDAWGADLRGLIAQWMGAIRKKGALIVQALLTPAHPVRKALATMQPLFRQPYTRNPYYLTLKHLGQDQPIYSFDFNSWHFIGGDIL
ncbi:GNAT family N-acetyltransferase [Phototrophicus methaneseepsis]|uniref:GNAT family N-acetyltransferase n=1 Tax=Phototrophicus methaneseepsis TaxID=2710758 RepID=A0A7S8EC14_9CHLR|nr:GNAT family N-acetyltransferase [Phototrophicus methaneseepsis]QPC83963.1 GNAT family N-acetyltransferase [Phototrophicus methaneseepsis]